MADWDEAQKWFGLNPDHRLTERHQHWLEVAEDHRQAAIRAETEGNQELALKQGNERLEALAFATAIAEEVTRGKPVR